MQIKAHFHFSEEWVSEKAIDINDKTQVPLIREIKEITPLLGHNQIFCDVNRQNIGMEIKRFIQKVNKTGKGKEAYELIKNYIRNGDLRYINYEVGINDQLTSKLVEKKNKETSEINN